MSGARQASWAQVRSDQSVTLNRAVTLKSSSEHLSPWQCLLAFVQESFFLVRFALLAFLEVAHSVWWDREGWQLLRAAGHGRSPRGYSFESS